MREEEEGNWFARWEEQLPSPEELMPLSQTLITPDLALAFDIPTHHSSPAPPPNASHHQHHHPASAPPSSSAQQHQGAEYEGGDLGNGGGGGSAGGGGGGGEEPARTLKRPRLVWTPQLHKRFVDAVAHLGIKNAVPKTIMQLMSVDGLTRENVASHLQKYRLYLKRMQGLSSTSGGAPGAAAVSPADAADHQLFASAPVPHHFLARGSAGGPADPFVSPYVPMAALQHHQQMAAVAAAAQQQQQQQYYQQRHAGHFGSPPAPGGGFDHHSFLSRAIPQPGMHRMVGPGGMGLVQPPPPPPPPPPPAASYVEDLESGTGGEGGGRRVLTLFPTGDD